MPSRVISDAELARELERETDELLRAPEFLSELRTLRAWSVVIRNYSSRREEALRQVNVPRLEAIAYNLYNAGLTDSVVVHSRDRYLLLAAELFEHLHLFYDPGSSRYEAMVIASAFCYSLAGYNANSSVVIRGLQPEKLSPLSFAASLLLTGQLSALKHSCQYGISEAKERQQGLVELFHTDQESQVDSNILEMWNLVAELRTYQGLLATVEYLLSDSGVHRRDAEQFLARAETICISNGLVDTWLICSGIRMAFSNGLPRTLWSNLHKSIGKLPGVWRRYVQKLASQNRAVTHLWPSQIAALGEGLLSEDGPSLVIRMPTSSGKTRVAEMAILQHLISDERENPLCVYIAPFRALEQEVQRSFEESLAGIGYRVSAIVGGYESDEFEQFITTGSDVLVVTPEKFDLMIRQHPKLLQRLSLLIVDEGHIIGRPPGEYRPETDSRSLRTELLISRILMHTKGATRVLWLSAVLPNTHELEKWLSRGRVTKVLTSSWRPTRRLEGYFYFQGDQGRLRYIAPEAFEVFGFLNKRQVGRGRRTYPDTTSQTAAELALHFAQSGGVIVFTSTRRYAEAVARALKDAIEQRKSADPSFDLIDRSLDRPGLSLARSALGVDHPLIQYMELGFGYHHGQVPESVRHELESAFKQNHVRILVATTTLAAGVNLPAKTVIVSHLNRGQDQYVSVQDFRNIAGRAGRAFIDTEGQIILLSNQATLNRHQRNYLSETAIEPVESALVGFFEKLVELRCPDVHSPGVEIPVHEEPAELAVPLNVIDTHLLSLMVEETVNTDDQTAIEATLGYTLFEVQKGNVTFPFDRATSYWFRRARTVHDKVQSPELRRAFYLTGLSVRGCEQCSNYAATIVDSHPELLLAYDSLTETQQMAVLEGAFQAPETRAVGLPFDAVVRLTHRWIQGVSLQELAREFVDQSNVLSNRADLVTTLETEVVGKAAWGIHAFTSLLEHHTQMRGLALHGSHKFLASMVKFGVPSPLATYACTLGVDRAAALRLSEYFTQRSRVLTHEEFVDWLLNVSVDTLLEVFRDMPDQYHHTRRVISRALGYNLYQHGLFIHQGATTARVFSEDSRTQRHAVRLAAQGEPLRLVPEDHAIDPALVHVMTESGVAIGTLERQVAKFIAAFPERVSVQLYDPIFTYQEPGVVLVSLNIQPS